jgi:tetratricopeptide (TPR) repeat protein
VAASFITIKVDRLTMSKNVLITLMIFIIYSPASTQVDYNDIRSDILTVECGGYKDSNLVKANIDTLHALSRTNFKNKYRLYRELGHNYYLRWALTENEVFLESAIQFFLKSIESKPKYGPTYLELALCLYFQNNCQRALQYLDYYQLYTKRKYQDTSQINQIKKRCD